MRPNSQGFPNGSFPPIADTARTDHRSPMTAYADMDDVIDAWVKATGSTLFNEWAGRPARFFHVPGTPPFDCFQVSIDPPSGSRVAVSARSIDTNDDAEMEQVWEGSVGELDAMLAAAMTAIETWKQRREA